MTVVAGYSELRATVRLSSPRWMATRMARLAAMSRRPAKTMAAPPSALFGMGDRPMRRSSKSAKPADTTRALTRGQGVLASVVASIKM